MTFHSASEIEGVSGIQISGDGVVTTHVVIHAQEFFSSRLDKVYDEGSDKYVTAPNSEWRGDTGAKNGQQGKRPFETSRMAI